jgi:hypothetical protein
MGEEGHVEPEDRLGLKVPLYRPVNIALIRIGGDYSCALSTGMSRSLLILGGSWVAVLGDSLLQFHS